MPFRSGSLTYTISVPRRDGGSVRISTGTRNLALAKRMEHAVRAVGSRGLQDWKLLAALADKRVTLAAFYDAYERRDLGALAARIDDLDLAPLVARWGLSLTNKCAAEYRREVALYFAAASSTRRSAFTPDAIRTYLDRWPRGSTRNRYRSSLANFANWCVETRHLARSPVTEVRRSREPDPRVVWYTDAVSQSVIAQLDGAHAALEALMCSTSAEWGACSVLVRSDIDPDTRTVQAHGSKTKWRDREVVFTQDWAWSIFWRHARTVTPTARVFPMSYWTARARHAKAVTAARAGPSHLHDWRHTFAVRQLRAGMQPQIIARLMGHCDTNLLWRVYGRYAPDRSEYLNWKQANG